jgi:hypothetical protein
MNALNRQRRDRISFIHLRHEAIDEWIGAK